MQFRSTTDEMLAARFDPEPWESDGLRLSRERYLAQPPAHRKSAFMFNPRPEFIPSRDPEPWFGWDQFRGGDVRNASPFGYATFAPRPEYARPEPNPILVALRDELPSNPADWLGALDDEVHEDGTHHCWHHAQIVESNATPEHIEHARKVLTRLVNMFEED